MNDVKAMPDDELVSPRVKTAGISPKLHGPVGAPLAAVVYHLIVTGQVDRPQLGLLAVAGIGAIWSYFASPGKVVPA